MTNGRSQVLTFCPSLKVLLSRKSARSTRVDGVNRLDASDKARGLRGALERVAGARLLLAMAI